MKLFKCLYHDLTMYRIHLSGLYRQSQGHSKESKVKSLYCLSRARKHDLITFHNITHKP